MIFLLSWMLLAHSSFAYDFVDHNPDDVLTFLLLGDWGKGGTNGKSRKLLPDEESVDTNLVRTGDYGKDMLKKNEVLRQMQVATAMGYYSTDANPKPSFLIALGDNFYDDGVYSSTESRWEYLWKDVYLQYEALNIPWYPVFGNHDYGYGATGVQAQLTRTQEHTDDDIWIFPSTNYTRRFDIPGEAGGSVAVVFIDTTTLAPSINRCCNENGGVSEEVQTQRIENQLGHIERMLNDTVANPATWLLVAGHYPIFSASSNGDVAELKTYLLPLLQKYSVHAYLCGHDHTAEHLQVEGYDTEFFVVGAGSMQDTVDYSTEGQLIWGGPKYSSFASMNATVDDLTIVFRDHNGTVRYNYTLTNPNAAAARPSPLPTPVPGNSAGDTAEHSVFSWEFWSELALDLWGASRQNFAIASGGVAVMALMLLLCFTLYRRKLRSRVALAKKSKLPPAQPPQPAQTLQQHARTSSTNSLMRSAAARGSRGGSFYHRNKPSYVPLHEVGGDLEQGQVDTIAGHAEEDFDDPEARLGSSNPQRQTGKYTLLQGATASPALTALTTSLTVNSAPTAPTRDSSPRDTCTRRTSSSPSRTSSGGTPRESPRPSPRGSPRSAAAAEIEAEGEQGQQQTGRSRASTLHGTGTGTGMGTAEHSRNSSSSFTSDESFPHHPTLYSRSLSSDQLAIASAWLSTHARSPSSVVPLPPPPSPSLEQQMSIADERSLPGEVLNPLLPYSATSSPSPSPSSGKPPRRPVISHSPHNRRINAAAAWDSGGSSATGGNGGGESTFLPRSSPPRDRIPSSRMSPPSLLPQGSSSHRRTTTSPM